MSKYKVNHTIAAILLIASFFAGWQTMVIVGALLFVFCEMGENIKKLAVNLISFSIGIELVEILWKIIYKASELIPGILDKLIGIINYYLDPFDKISLTKLNLYVISPITDLFDIGNSVFEYLIAIASFVFITSLLIGANKKGFVIDKFISKYVNNVINYVSQFGAPQTAPVAPVQNINNQMPLNQNINNIQSNNNAQNFNSQPYNNIQNFNGQSNNMM